jgi:8-oxo-dGTP pyrophosphatase MutT (NUDIX family)
MNKEVSKIKNESVNYSKEIKPLFRKGVSALIKSNQNKFLLVNLESFEEHFFAIPGGGLDGDESNEDGVYREIGKELGITRQSLELVGVCQEPLRFKFKTKKLFRDGVEYDGSERRFLVLSLWETKAI